MSCTVLTRHSSATAQHCGTQHFFNLHVALCPKVSFPCCWVTVPVASSKRYRVHAVPELGTVLRCTAKSLAGMLHVSFRSRVQKVMSFRKDCNVRNNSPREASLRCVVRLNFTTGVCKTTCATNKLRNATAYVKIRTFSCNNYDELFPLMSVSLSLVVDVCVEEVVGAAVGDYKQQVECIKDRTTNKN